MNIKDIDEALEEGQSLKAIAQAYSEIANLKVKKIRANVERNRLFYNEISRVYSIVKAFALKKKITITKPKNRLCILLTSNDRFYGNINSSLINYFVGLSRELADVDKIILGKAGINYFRAAKLLPKYQEIMLKKDLPDSRELAELARLSSEYNQVLVFHSTMKSLMIQQATFTDVTAVSLYMREFLVKHLDPKNKEGFMRFIFEPDLPKVLQFFDTQVLTLMLEQTFLESELSRTASRFISMDQAETEANKFIKEYEALKAYTKRNADNNTILENFATMMAVKR
ncbi:F0F1 ATP synthase subunit gamma [Candidatus Daviesbacteria bacterium]|nr:F0F1 ATP synthase subunit gamma [Candidatus Daviesbacteria bacterium]